MARKNFTKALNCFELRQQLGLTQTEFWRPLGVTQSAGSRYENGRAVPRPVHELVRVRYVERIDTAAISREDWAVVSHLKETDPDLYEKLKRIAAKSLRQSP
jgi:transcriptional regulator with XRE-family HTH domain